MSKMSIWMLSSAFYSSERKLKYVAEREFHSYKIRTRTMWLISQASVRVKLLKTVPRDLDMKQKILHFAAQHQKPSHFKGQNWKDSLIRQQFQNNLRKIRNSALMYQHRMQVLYFLKIMSINNHTQVWRGGLVSRTHSPPSVQQRNS